MSEPERFWDRMANRYGKTPIADEAAYQKKLQLTRKYFRPDMQVLEIGCGTGSTAISHAPFVKHIHAVDISSKMLEIARSKADDVKVDNVTFEQSAIEDLDLPDQSFDAVLALSILHLLEDKEAAIAEVFRLLKPGGVFVSSTVCLGDAMSLFRIIAPVGRFLGLFPLVRAFTVRELESSITDAGFDIEQKWQHGKAEVAFIVAKRPA